MALSEGLKVMDGGGLFERMLEEFRKVGRDESVEDQLATAKILSDFAKRICCETKKGTQKASSLGKRKPATTTTEDPTYTSLLGKQKRNITKRLENIQPKQPVNFAEMGLDPPPNLPTNVRNYIESKGEVEDLTLVIMKPYFGIDLSLQQARLSIPSSQVLGDFLGQEDKVKLGRGEAINMTLILPCLNEELPMSLKKYSQLGTYRLI